MSSAGVGEGRGAYNDTLAVGREAAWLHHTPREYQKLLSDGTGARTGRVNTDE